MQAKQHPLQKTHLELKRCHYRLNLMMEQFPEDETDKIDMYLEIISLIEKSLDLIPKEYR